MSLIPFVSDYLLLFLVAAPDARVACGSFGFALHTSATFDVFPELEVANDGLFYVVFESTPHGSDHADVCLLCIFVQPAFPSLFGGNLLPTSPGEGKPKNCLLRIAQEL